MPHPERPEAVTAPSVQLIRDADLCIGCGACRHVCPYQNIAMQLTPGRGKWEPDIADPATCQRCAGEKLCLDVCPSYGVDYVTLADSDRNRLLGRVEAVHCGHSTDDQTRLASSSGGFIRELCRGLLARGDIDGVISIRHDGGLDYSPAIVRDAADMPNSVYHSINFENAFRLIAENDGRFLVIGIPCQITSITLLLRRKKYRHLAERVHGKVALICGYVHERRNVEATAEYLGRTLDEITYRGRGRTLVIAAKGEQDKEDRGHDGGNDVTGVERDNAGGVFIDTFYPKTVSEMINSRMMLDNYLPQRGCLFCEDHIGYCADLVVGDAWLNRFDDDKSGTNIIICRTPRGQALVDSVEGVHLTDGSLDDIIKSQGEFYAQGSFAVGMRRLDRRRGGFMPKRRRTDNPGDLIDCKFKIKNIIKMRLVKPLIMQGRFQLARAVYFVVELPAVASFLWNRRKGPVYRPPFDVDGAEY